LQLAALRAKYRLKKTKNRKTAKPKVGAAGRVKILVKRKAPCGGGEDPAKQVRLAKADAAVLVATDETADVFFWTARTSQFSKSAYANGLAALRILIHLR